MGQRVAFNGEVNRIGEPKGNRVLTVRQSLGADPKHDELAMGRMKVR